MKQQRRVLRVTGLCFLICFSTGFRLIGDMLWDIEPSDPTLWIKNCETNFVFQTVNLPDTHPLKDAPALDYKTVMQSIIDDYNNIQSSYLRFAFYPDDPDSPPDTVSGDSDFTIDRASKRTIDICMKGTDSLAGIGTAGHASPKLNGRTVTACEIRALPQYKEDAGEFVALATHEIGHCVGLGHPQETTHAVMSYFSDWARSPIQPWVTDVRLQNDDRAGITHQYPTDPGMGRESYDLGFGCSGFR